MLQWVSPRDLPVDLSSDGSVRLEAPSTVVARNGESAVGLEVHNLCNSSFIAVYERGGMICVIGLESPEVVIVEPSLQRVRVVGLLDRLDFGGGYDCGGMQRLSFYELPNSDDLLVEYEFGVARIDVSGLRLAWHQIHGDITTEHKYITDDRVVLGGEDTRFSYRLTDGSFNDESRW